MTKKTISANTINVRIWSQQMRLMLGLKADQFVILPRLSRFKIHKLFIVKSFFHPKPLESNEKKTVFL
jgi:hypothetical protein